MRRVLSHAVLSPREFILSFTHVVSTARSLGPLGDVPLCACTTVRPLSNHESLILSFFYFFKEHSEMAHTQTPETPWVLPRGQLRHQDRGRPDGRIAGPGPRWAWAPPPARKFS